MPVQFDVGLVDLLFPVYPVCEYCLVLSCPALMSLLNIIIWVYILVCVFLFPPRVCTMTEDQTKTVSGAHSPRFVLRFEKFYFVPVFMYVCPAAWKSPLVIPAIAHCKSAWEFGGITASAASPLAASPHARRSREISVAGGGSPKPAGSLPSSRVAAPPGAPITPPHCLWLNARRPASDSMPAGPPLS